MEIKVTMLGKFRKLAESQTTLTLNEGTCFIDMLEYLCNRYGDEFRAEINKTKRLQILLNGKYYNPERNDSLKDGDLFIIREIVLGG